MKRSKLTEEQVVGILRVGTAVGVKAACAKANISERTYYKSKKRYGGMEVSDMRQMRAMEAYWRPVHIRGDNGPEFVADAVKDWLEARKIGTINITPGSRWENGHIESFHDKIKDECLKRELFGNRAEARFVIGTYRCQYNQQRPDRSLGYKTPEERAARALTALRPTASAPSACARNNINQRTEICF